LFEIPTGDESFVNHLSLKTLYCQWDNTTKVREEKGAKNATSTGSHARRFFLGGGGEGGFNVLGSFRFMFAGATVYSEGCVGINIKQLAGNITTPCVYITRILIIRKICHQLSAQLVFISSNTLQL
jgi:hypothetical protein